MRRSRVSAPETTDDVQADVEDILPALLRRDGDFFDVVPGGLVGASGAEAGVAASASARNGKCETELHADPAEPALRNQHDVPFPLIPTFVRNPGAQPKPRRFQTHGGIIRLLTLRYVFISSRSKALVNRFDVTVCFIMPAFDPRLSPGANACLKLPDGRAC